MARPLKILDMHVVAKLMRMKPTLADTAAFFKTSEDTIERRIHEDTGLTFIQFRDRHMVSCRHDLIRTAIDKALKGDNQMLTLCLKHMCGWSDKSSTQQEDIVIKLGYDPHPIDG